MFSPPDLRGEKQSGLSPPSPWPTGWVEWVRKLPRLRPADSLKRKAWPTPCAAVCHEQERAVGGGVVRFGPLLRLIFELSKKRKQKSGILAAFRQFLHFSLLMKFFLLPRYQQLISRILQFSFFVLPSRKTMRIPCDDVLHFVR